MLFMQVTLLRNQYEQQLGEAEQGKQEELRTLKETHKKELSEVYEQNIKKMEEFKSQVW